MANSDTLQKQDGFKSQFGFIMAAVGSCVGMEMCIRDRRHHHRTHGTL